MNGAFAIRYTALDYDAPPAASDWMAQVEVAIELTPSRRAIVDQMYIRALNVWQQLADSDVELDPSISLETLKRVFACLPPGLPETEAYVSHAGSVCLDWDDNPTNTLSLIIKAGGQVAYASYFDGERSFGSFDFSGKLHFSIDRAVERWVVREQRFCEVN